MNPKYIISKFGKHMLSYNGYHLTMNRKPLMIDDGTKTYWKCTIKSADNQRCRATAISYSTHGIERAVFKGTHSHPAQSLINHKYR